MTAGFDLFREQAAAEYNRLTNLLPGSRPHVIARARRVITQLDHYALLPDLTEAEIFWLEVIRESFVELIENAGGTP